MWDYEVEFFLRRRRKIFFNIVSPQSSTTLQPGPAQAPQGLDRLVHKAEEVTGSPSSPARPATDQAVPPMLAAESGRACILYTATVTAFTREQALEKKHSWHRPSILGYNAAMWAMRAASGLQLIDSGTLSLLPALSNWRRMPAAARDGLSSRH